MQQQNTNKTIHETKHKQQHHCTHIHVTLTIQHNTYVHRYVATKHYMYTYMQQQNTNKTIHETKHKQQQQHHGTLHTCNTDNTTQCTPVRNNKTLHVHVVHATLTIHVTPIEQHNNNNNTMVHTYM
jgi:hypothetical protein